jgi:hypothetical protein
MKNLLSSIFILSFLISSTQAQNLIKNNKFNAGVEGWEVLLSEKGLPIKAQVIEHSQDYGSYGLADNYINTSFVELDATSAIQQRIDTDNSDNYTLIFAYAHRPNAGDKQLVVTANGTVIHTETVKNNASIGGFKYKHIYFNAPSTTTKLSFYAVSISGPDDQGVLLTDISCEKTAEISINNSNNTKKTH